MKLFGNVRYALRQFRLSPLFTATVVFTLALGIGGTTAIFSLMHAVLMSSLPVADPASLYRVGAGNDCCVEGSLQGDWGMYSFPLYERLKLETPEFKEVAAFQAAPSQFSVRREAVDRISQSLRSEFVSGNYFSTLGVRPFAGRLFFYSDDQPAAPPVAVLSHHVWQDTYGADPSVVGSSYIIGGCSFTIVGIAPPGFFGETLRSDPADLWLPLQQEPAINGESSLLRQPIPAWLRVIGRLKPGATVAGMSARLTDVLRRWLENESGRPAAWLPDLKRALHKQNINVIPAGGGVAEMKENYGRNLQILLAVCGIVLLIACANVANLLLARGMARRGETSVRIAIGASPACIISQSLVESVLLALGGGIAGLVVADLAGRLLVGLAFKSARFLPINTAPSTAVLTFALILSLGTALLFGIAPAWLATNADPAGALRGANRQAGDRSSFIRKALLVMQATLSIVLVAGAAMLTRSLHNLEHQDFGFETNNRINVSVNPPPVTYSQERLDALYRDLGDRLNRVPGIERSTLALYAPLTDNWGEFIVVAGHPAPSINDDNSVASWDRVSPTYFQTVGQAIIRGRGLADTDDDRTAPVAVVNQTFVRRFFPAEDPIDKHFGMDLAAYAGMFRIVGIVRDAKYTQPTEPVRPMFFLPLAQHAHYSEEIMQKIDLRSHFIGSVLLVTRNSPGTLEPILSRIFAEVDPNLTITSVRTMEQQVEMRFDQQRAVASLATLFGVVALILASVGLYGLTAYTVAQRTNEIGVRMALGADRTTVIRFVLRDAFTRVAIGLSIGIPLAIGAGRLIASQLYGVASWDPVALSVAVISLGACASVAAIIPANRAASLEPMEALRIE